MSVAIIFQLLKKKMEFFEMNQEYPCDKNTKTWEKLCSLRHRE